MMSTFLMDKIFHIVLEKIVFSISHKLVKKYISEMSQHKVMGKIEKFCGDDNKYLIFTIQESLETAISESIAIFTQTSHLLAVQQEYRTYLREIHDVALKNNYYLIDPTDLRAQQEFLEACQSHCPSSTLSWLHKRVIETNISGNLVEDLAKCTDYVQFQVWRTLINNTAGYAAFYRVCYLNLTISKTGVTETLKRELANITSNIIDIKQRLKEKSAEMKTAFLDPCEDPNHKRCGTASGKHCTVLGKEIYGHLLHHRHDGQEENPEIANSLRELLAKTYSWYLWSVVIVKFDKYEKDLLFCRDYNRRFSDELRLQHLGAETVPALFKEAFVGDVTSHGKQYGQMTVFYVQRFGLASGRAAHVYWGEARDLHVAADIPPELTRRLQDPSVAKMLLQKDIGDDIKYKPVKDLLRRHNFEYIHVLAISTSDAMAASLAHERDVKWPICSSSTTGHVIIWPVDFEETKGKETQFQMIVAGGCYENGISAVVSAECFSSATQRWCAMPHMPAPRSLAAAVTIQSQLCVFGGWDGNGCTNSVLNYDQVSNNWKSTYVAPMKHARHSHAAVVLADQVYVLGGLDVSDKLISSVEVWSSKLNSWSSASPLRNSRSRLAVAINNGLLYACGGINENGSIVNTVEVYNPVKKRWKTLTPMNATRCDFGLGVAGGSVYAVGGFSQNTLNTCERFDSEKNIWINVANMQEPRGGLSVVAANGKLYAVGGSARGGRFTRSVEIYDPGLNTWTTSSFPMSEAKQFHVSTVFM